MEYHFTALKFNFLKLILFEFVKLWYFKLESYFIFTGYFLNSICEASDKHFVIGQKSIL